MACQYWNSWLDHCAKWTSQIRQQNKGFQNTWRTEVTGRVNCDFALQIGAGGGKALEHVLYWIVIVIFRETFQTACEAVVKLECLFVKTMPRTFLVKSFKKREGKTLAEVENCTLHDEITNYQQKKRKNSEDAEVFTPNTAAASLTGKSQFCFDYTLYGFLFVWRNPKLFLICKMELGH